MPKLQVNHLSKVFGDPKNGGVVALDNVSMDVTEGEVVAIVGPSGCGKTTLLRIIQGLETKSDGEIRIDGQPTKGVGFDRGFVFQQYGLLPWMTAKQNITFALEPKKIPKQERIRKAKEALEKVGLKDFEDSYPRQLSGGMQQRVGIARALAIEPDILLLDEPFGALDALTREVLQNEILRLIEEMRKTVIFVTHSVDEAVYLADRIVLMSPRPGQIKTIIPVEIPRPRAQKAEEVRGTQAYQSVRQNLWRQLMEVM
ncbi:NitT/TauT family transport system ATP-binding protein [Natronocella acetinitrilica]|uniref:NitT/TauT family transport system ATP-binding protein n=1 Tax=Natronocella acetinitrilica TaxID=414046 RepID=A0AAE3KD38_9GAMM|nr:ABC transporter ATP-binding protein [Natronocella acetinitrilica]MCP1676401.1 NitT/TauT family transport system ATP-binding protein [Natronocella acetinitrilica]